jgi:hypothetical protein
MMCLHKEIKHSLNLGNTTPIITIFYLPTSYLNTGNSRLSGIMEGRKVTGNPKPWLKQKQ